MAPPQLRFAFEIDVTVAAPLDLGETQNGHRRIVAVQAGRVAGPRLQGIVLEGGADWQIVRPDGCTEISNDKGRIVLAYGEVTGHAHAISDHRPKLRAGEIAEAAIARARLYRAPSGDRYLEVKETVHLVHEEHSTHALLPGVYKLPVQTEYSPQELRRVQD